MRTLNLGILAHVDAGKTTLTERLLYTAGVIDEVGSVDLGTTQTDSLALERQRGITIKSAVVSFVIGDVTVNLIDTPGHPDFIAEVERVLSVLDGAVLVISAVEGVQAQTRVLMRTLHRLSIPTLLFVNKIDRRGADERGVLEAITAKLTPAIVPMGWTDGLGTKESDFTRFDEDDDDVAVRTKGAGVHPVFFGSAITGAGITALVDGIAELLPAEEGDALGPVSGTIFKIDRGPSGERVAYLRMFSGTVHTRDALKPNRKITALRVFELGAAVATNSLAARQIGQVWGLGDIKIGDVIGAAPASREQHHFAPPTLETVVVPRNARDGGALRVALAQLAEQDPLINVRQDDAHHEISVSLYGEVQKEVIQATLAADFAIEVEFRETTTIYIERVIGIGTALEVLQSESHPYSATIGLRIEPLPPESGVEVRLDVDPRTLPLFIYKTRDRFVTAMTHYVERALRTGLFGWVVTDCAVTMTESGYYASDGPRKPVSPTPRSTAKDFRKLTPIVLRRALEQARTVVCEPMLRVTLEVPSDTVGATLSLVAQLGGVVESPTPRGEFSVIDLRMSAAAVQRLRHQLPALTFGEGVAETTFGGFDRVRGTPRVRGARPTS